MRKRLEPIFFDRPAPIVAHDLIGKYLIRIMDGVEMAQMMTEVEAYAGPEDLASHARFGKTARTAPMFGPPGTVYVYFTYGMHFMLNLVCGREGDASAVLIRGTQDIAGPARLTKKLGIDKTLSGKMLGRASGLWIEDRGVTVAPKQIRKTPRIGIDYAGDWVRKKWRFVLKNEELKKKTAGLRRDLPEPN